MGTQVIDVHRHEDGSIDYDCYRTLATQLRIAARKDLLSAVWRRVFGRRVRVAEGLPHIGRSEDVARAGPRRPGKRRSAAKCDPVVLGSGPVS